MSDARNTSIIEQAAKRLAELKRAGVETPDMPASQTARPIDAPSVERAIGKLSAVENGPFRSPGSSAHPLTAHAGPLQAAAVAAQAPAIRPMPPMPMPMPRPEVPPRGPARSRKVDINLAALEQDGYLVPTMPMTQLSEEFRIIKRPLLHNLQPRDGERIDRANLIVVTSSLAGEGKTFTAINLALSIATELDRTVLLVDADVTRPMLLERLGLPESKGLLDVLTQDVPLAECILRTNVEKLTVLPAGTRHQRATELLASEAMDQLVDELARRYPDRVVIFDAPPLLASTESRVLANHMGQVLFVVEADRTAQTTINEAMATVESCPHVYTVLNKARTPASDGPYSPTRH